MPCDTCNLPRCPYTHFCKDFFRNVLQKRKSISITLDGDENTNIKKLELARYEAQKIKYTCDTATKVSVNFLATTNYGNLIKLLKICLEDEHTTYGLIDHTFMIWYVAPLKRPSTNELRFIYL